MAISCGAKCAKGFLIAFNFFFWVSGCCLLAVGIYMLIDKENKLLFKLFSTNGGNYALPQYLALALIGIGSVVFLVGFCGCCGAIRESRWMLATYFIFLFLIMGAELAVGILSVIFRDKILHETEKLEEVLKAQYGIEPQMTEAIDYAQTKFKCCGIKGHEDYEDSKWKELNLGKGDQVAKTCCILSNADHLDPKPVNRTWCQSIKPSEYIPFRYVEGCLLKLFDFVKQTCVILVIVGCSIATLEIFGMVFAICLCKEV